MNHSEESQPTKTPTAPRERRALAHRSPFSTLLREDLIIDQLTATDSEDALRRMASLLVTRGYCHGSFVEAIIERERAHPSALPMTGHKIAIPHTDAEHVVTSAILFARLAKPVPFRSMGDPGQRIPVRLVSMFALKESTKIGDLLTTLITVYQNDTVLDTIIRAPDAATMLKILQHHVDGAGRHN